MSNVVVGQPIVQDASDADMTLTYEVIKDDYSRAGEASSGIKKVLRQIGMDPEVIRRVAVATYEAEINVVIHSLGGSITVLIKPNVVEIFVSDIGPGIPDVSKALTAGYSTATQKAREMGFGAGMGLPNIIRMCDFFQIDSVEGEYTHIYMKMESH